MPHLHAPFCDLPPGRRGHGPYCVSRPVARQVIATSEAGKTTDITIDLAVRRSEFDGPRMVRLIGEPPDINNRFVAMMSPGSARQLATALLNAAGQAEELDQDVNRPKAGRRVV